MKNDACICFLQWALPHLHLRWPGFRKVRGQVCKRIGRRLEELLLPDLKSYRTYLQDNPLEWYILDAMCRITISRFFRDRRIHEILRSQVFPGLIGHARRQGEKTISCWCIGAASGEEPYSIGLLWDLSGLHKQGIDLTILATEIDQIMINRAKAGCYPASSIREVPSEIKEIAFIQEGARFCLQEKYKKRVQFLQQDIRNDLPDSTFHIIFCRNLVFTYFTMELQEEMAGKISKRLKPGGGLVLGTHEKLSGNFPTLTLWSPSRSMYRRKGDW